MKSLNQYINKTISPLKLTPEQKEKLLKLDEEYGKLYKEFWYKWDRTDCTNLLDEYDKFIAARNNGSKYYPQLKLVRDELDESWLETARRLKSEFSNFSCFLSRYYIQNIDYMYAQADMTIHKDDPVKLNVCNHMLYRRCSQENYKYAWDLIRKHPYKDMREEQPFRGPDVVSKMKSHMKKRGYGFNVELNPNMVARQNVEPHNKTLHIKTDGYFSQLDVESLRIHEIDVHVARRYYGYLTGLNLFADGLLYRNTTDEGLAINTSLHFNKYGVKPNLEFDIAIKFIIGYHLFEYDFCQMFDYLIDKVRTKQNKDIIELVVFKNICRFKRIVQDCSKPGGDSHGETDYLEGYRMVHNMSEAKRKELIKWNIGPDQIKDLPKIKEFFRVNKFKPLI